jgi:uncharacterized protein YbaA (DUF1428 family)
MKRIIFLIALALVASAFSGAAADQRFFELRTYNAAPGKLDELHARFRDHTMKLFEKHGMSNVGYWVPSGNPTNSNPANQLIYLLAYPSRDAREKSWKDFMADPEWQAAQQASEANGKLVAKVDSVYLNATGFMSAVGASTASAPRLFDLHTFKSAPGRIYDLHMLVSKTYLPLFRRYGIGQMGYFAPADKDKGADDTLICILVHKDRETAVAAWKSLRQDPALARAQGGAGASEQTIYMVPTAYSPVK